MAEEFCTVGDIELCYETFGSPAHPAMLLIMGLGTQMIAWPDEFCDRLAEDGFFVIRFDNRGIERAHIVGASMGGMIAQVIAIEHPGRTLSLASIMSNTGSRLTGQP